MTHATNRLLLPPFGESWRLLSLPAVQDEPRQVGIKINHRSGCHSSSRCTVFAEGSLEALEDAWSAPVQVGPFIALQMATWCWPRSGAVCTLAPGVRTK